MRLPRRISIHDGCWHESCLHYRAIDRDVGSFVIDCDACCWEIKGIGAGSLGLFAPLMKEVSMKSVVCVAVVLPFVVSVTAIGAPPAPALPGSPVAVTTAAQPARGDETGVVKAKTVDEQLADMDARVAAAKARQEEIDRKTKAMGEEESRLRAEAMETGKKMWGMTDLDADSGSDEEMAALKKKIAELEAQTKALREEMQKKLENNPEFLQRKLKLQDTQKSIIGMRKERGELMQEKAKLNAELQQIERDRLPLLQRREAEAAKAAEAKKTAVEP